MRKVYFGAKLSREQTQERATDVGPVKDKEKERERERERERECEKKESKFLAHHHERLSGFRPCRIMSAFLGSGHAFLGSGQHIMSGTRA